MTNRRTFFKLAGSFVAGVALGLHCKLTAVEYKNLKALPNPAYSNVETAPYEVAYFITSDNQMTGATCKRHTDGTPLNDELLGMKRIKVPFPYRLDKDFKLVLPYILVES